MREYVVENHLKSRLKKMNALYIKLTSSSLAGLPDRLILLKGGKVLFVELKAPNKKPRPLQKYVFNLLAKYGHTVYVLDSVEGVDEFVADIQAARLPKKSGTEDN